MKEHAMIRLTINGTTHELDVDPSMPLLFAMLMNLPIVHSTVAAIFRISAMSCREAS